MDACTLPDETPQRKPTVLIRAFELRRRLGGIGRTLEFYENQRNPDFPVPVWRGNRKFYIEAEVEAYIARLIAERDATVNGDANNGDDGS